LDDPGRSEVSLFILILVDVFCGRQKAFPQRSSSCHPFWKGEAQKGPVERKAVVLAQEGRERREARERKGEIHL
jgi:hypothetical protein